MKELGALFRSVGETEAAAIIDEELKWSQEKIRKQWPARAFLRKLRQRAQPVRG